MSALTFSELEVFYDELANAMDAAGPDQESVFLAKLVLSMAQEFGQAERLSALVAECLKEPSTELVAGTQLL